MYTNKQKTNHHQFEYFDFNLIAYATLTIPNKLINLLSTDMNIIHILSPQKYSYKLLSLWNNQNLL
jgi:hypothetical protein